ncbi:YjzC family protein [Peribacillus deserti]|uniref:YjzC family protein n=1 Tax=Peribacillus deserti TaxID=673318 RepID=A0A2N5M7P9_9BACI|nr:YjzC family protein [Peribacillus deserti]PLT30394.1 YjzC family protein [Peribacillus deserti]
MGQNNRFKPGNKAPNNGTYVEVGVGGSMVIDPRTIHLKAGDPFPETSNHERQWIHAPKPQH